MANTQASNHHSSCRHLNEPSRADGGAADAGDGQEQHGHGGVGAAHPAHLRDDVVHPVARIDEPRLET